MPSSTPMSRDEAIEKLTGHMIADKERVPRPLRDFLKGGPLPGPWTEDAVMTLASDLELGPKTGREKFGRRVCGCAGPLLDPRTWWCSSCKGWRHCVDGLEAVLAEHGLEVAAPPEPEESAETGEAHS